ncbi:MAG: glutamate--tRNA ligase [Nitrospirota bacterium]
MTVRVRFAPSPTGALHIGGARTALFNWLFARHHGGTYILRIEDTDRERSTEDSIREIHDGLAWLGLDWDEGPFRQTERMDLYRARVQELLDRGLAYRCWCTAEELEARRKEATAAGKTPRYDGRCRGLADPPADRSFAVRFAAPREGETVVEDLVKGRVVFDNRQLDDLIVLRSDGTPTYNFCVVVDDVDMKITHVIRGDDHLNNTPRQAGLYRAFGFDLPKFAHVPMILGADKARLSKRHGATSVTAYREQGYLPEALVNYLARLGWSSGDQEIFSRGELIEKFDLAHVGTAPAVFNPEKLVWLNAHYIKEAERGRLGDLLSAFLPPRETWPADAPDPAAAAQAHKERSRTLVEMAESAQCYYAGEVKVDDAAAAKHLTPQAAGLLKELADRIEKMSEFTAPALETLFNALASEKGVKMGALAQPSRVALTGKAVSPGIFDVFLLVGRRRAVSRLRAAAARAAG